MPRTFFYLILFTLLYSYGISQSNENLTTVNETSNDAFAASGSLPEAEFMANVTIGCTPLTVQFTDLSTGEISARDWTFTGGNPAVSSEINPIVVYETAGTYDVALVVSNSSGMDEMVKFAYITVIDRPIANFTFLPDMLTVNFQNTSMDADSLSWNFGDGELSMETDPTHTYSNEGMYTVTLIAINGCASDTFTLDLNLQNSPTGGFGSDKQVGCSPLMIQFFDQSSGTVDTWEWAFEGGIPATSDIENPLVIFDIPGMYNVSLITTNSAGSDTTLLEDYITVLEDPIADFSFEVFLDSVSFTNTSQFADSYIWIFDDGDSSTLENPSHIFEEPGIYNVELIAINECGEVSQVFKIIPAIPPTAEFAIADGNGNGCTPFVVEFIDNSEGAISTWAWTFEGGDPMTSNSPNPTITYNDIGVFKVELIVTNQFGIDTMEMDSLIFVTNQPQADFTFIVESNTVTFQNTSSDGVVHFWDYGDGSQATEFESTHVYDTAGAYTIQLVAVNACGLDTIVQEVTIEAIINTSTNSLLPFDLLSIFPNPNNGQFQLQMEGLQTNVLEVVLLNVLGQTILERRIAVNNGLVNEQFNLNSKNAGMFLIRIGHGDNLISKRFLVY